MIKTVLCAVLVVIALVLAKLAGPAVFASVAIFGGLAAFGVLGLAFQKKRLAEGRLINYHIR